MMAELTRAERSSWRERLEKPQSLIEFGAAFDELHEHLGLHSITQHGIEFFSGRVDCLSDGAVS